MSGNNLTRVYPTFQLGYLHGLSNYTPSNPGHISSGDTSICTTDYISVATAQKIYFDDTTYKMLVCYYNAEKSYVEYTNYSTTSPLILDTQYVYCVPELRKLDSSVFNSVPEDPAYYNVELEMDIARSADIERVEAELRKPIQPSLLPNLPIGVFRSITGYSCELPYTSLDGYARFYVDSENGLDTNSGTSVSPVKTIARAINLMRNVEHNSVIEITNGSMIYADGIPDSIGATKNLIIRSNGRATLIAGAKPTFTESGSHYVSEAIIDHTIMGCINMGATDDYGVHVPMTKVNSIEAVDETDNSYYIDATNNIVYVHSSTNIADVVVLFSDKFALRLVAASLSESGFVMCENLTLIGNSTFTGRAASTVGETIQRTAYIKNCIFEHGITNNVVSFNDYEYTYLVDCVSGYGKNDCYNYHFTKKPTPSLALVVEVNCVSKESGYYNDDDASDNLSTCHDEANILRCGCHGYNGNGSMCVDANGCYSVCVDCTYVNTSYNKPSGANRSAFEFYDSVGQRNGKSMMQDCFGYDIRNNSLVRAVDLILSGVNAGGSINATNVTVAKEVI